MSANPVCQSDRQAVGESVRPPPARRTRTAWLGVVILPGLVAAAHGQTLFFGLVLDDPLIVMDNPLLRGQVGWWHVFTSPTAAYLPRLFGADRMYRLVLALTLVADRVLWGTRPRGFHLSNLLAHVAAVLLLWRLAWWITGSAWAAFAAGALLAVHPSAVEAVAFVAARGWICSSARGWPPPCCSCGVAYKREPSGGCLAASSSSSLRSDRKRRVWPFRRW